MMSATQFSSQMVKNSKREDFCRKVCLNEQHVFAAFANKKVTINCSIIDVGHTIFFSNGEELEKRRLL